MKNCLHYDQSETVDQYVSDNMISSFVIIFTYSKLTCTNLYKMQSQDQKSCLVSGNRPGEKFLSLTRPHSQMCSIRICIFNFKKQQTNHNKNKNKKKQTKEERKISPENRLKNKFVATWVKNFLVTRVSGNKSIIFFGPINVNFKYFLRFFSICNNVFVYALLLTCLIFLFTSLK